MNLSQKRGVTGNNGKPQNRLYTIKRLWDYLMFYKWVFILAIISFLKYPFAVFMLSVVSFVSSGILRYVYRLPVFLSILKFSIS